MEFHFIEEDTTDDEDTIDLSNLVSYTKTKKEVRKTRRATKSKRLDEATRSIKEKESSSLFSFEEDIPPARSITDSDVQAKARSSNRTRSVSKMSYENKREHGWSYCCAHPHHLPELCERYQNEGQFDCSCPCHTERGFVKQEEPEYIPGSDDEEVLLLIG